MLKIGLVGVGGISGAHIPAWEAMENAELVALCDIRPERMEKFEGKKRLYTSFEEMLANEELDILDICLPTYLHADFAVMAMEKGINVITEKPISLKEEDVERVYRTAEKNNVKFMVAQVLRFWPEYELLKEIYETKKYGKLLSGTMIRLGSYPRWSWDGWMMDEKRSGLVPFDLHIHDLDFMVYAFGMPKVAHQYRSKRPEQDYISITYDFGEFSINSEASWYASSYPFTAEFRFQFEDAIVANENGKMMIHLKNDEKIDLSQQAEGDTGAINLPKSDAYANEINYFADCVENNKPVEKVKPEQLECVLKILNNL
ncbi:MAG: Gfo/Idh/MocA family oxidoreductase [Ruminococcaceae bacterium]|nr:Gfo/Idh/MocA family oxidoreductase [Oscillospiraceae bacterium]